MVSKTYQRVMRRAAKNLRAKGLDKADAFCAEMEAIAKRHAERLEAMKAAKKHG